MAITPETQVANTTNQIIALASSCVGLAAQIAAVSAAWTNLSVATKLNAFPTAPLLTTGVLGTADGSPNVANPIDVRVTPGSDISRAISANDVAGLLTVLQGVLAVIGGSAVSLNGAAVQLLAKTQ